jgi:hypothetical protein
MNTNEYVIKTKVCRSLSKQFGLEEVTIDETTLINHQNNMVWKILM